MSFPAKRFNVELPSNGGTAWGLIGTSRSGKSTMMKHIYKEYFKKHITMMFSMNPHADIYKDMSKDIIVSDTYCPDVLREEQLLNKLCDNKYDFLMISDDYVDTKIKNDKDILRVLTVGRNCGMSSIFSFQGRVMMNACGRNQLNYVCIFKQQTPKEWKNVIDEYLDMWLPMEMTMPEKIAFCKAATVDHQFFFIDNISNECYISKLTKEQAGV